VTSGKSGSVTIGFIAEAETTSVVPEPQDTSAIDLARTVIEEAVISLVSKVLCERHTVIPVSRTGNYLIVAMADPRNRTTFDALRAHTGLQVEPVVASAAAIREAIARHYAA